jgi:hypothetical protein
MKASVTVPKIDVLSDPQAGRVSVARAETSRDNCGERPRWGGLRPFLPCPACDTHAAKRSSTARSRDNGEESFYA